MKSRAVRVDFKRNTDEEVFKAFQHKYGTTAVDKHILCEYADGIIGRALSMADPAQYEKICDKILQCVRDLPDGGGRALCSFENLFAEYAGQKEIFFFTLYSLFRDIGLSARYGESISLQNVQAVDRIQNLGGKIGYHNAMECVRQIGRTWRLLGQNVNYKLAADALAIRIQEVIHD